MFDLLQGDDVDGVPGACRLRSGVLAMDGLPRLTYVEGSGKEVSGSASGDTTFGAALHPLHAAGDDFGDSGFGGGFWISCCFRSRWESFLLATTFNPGDNALVMEKLGEIDVEGAL